jgi:hypothetical protein
MMRRVHLVAEIVSLPRVGTIVQCLQVACYEQLRSKTSTAYPTLQKHDV